MDSIYLKEPIIALLAIFIIALHIAAKLIGRKNEKATRLLNAANIVVHVVCFTLIFILGGDYSDALPLALISGIFALTSCKLPSGGKE